MPIGFTRTLGASSIPVWQGIGKDIQLAQGGFALVITGLPLGVVLPKGTPMNFDESARTATAMVSGVMYASAGSSATAYQVNKGHGFQVGNYFASGAAGGPAYAITSIDTSNPLYDTINVGTTIGAVTAGTTVYQSTATGATASAYPTITGLLYDDTTIATGESVSIVIRGTIYAHRVPYSVAIATALANKITYSQSK